MTETPMSDNKPYLLRAMHEWISDNDLTPYIYVDTRLAGVLLPDNLLAETPQVLNASLSACRNLSLSNDSVAFEARFSGKVYDVYLPMNAIIAIVARENGQGMTFDVGEIDNAEAGDTAAEQQSEKKAKPSGLKIVK